MKYVTEKEAKKAAKTSTKAAIECSIEHWKQLLKAHKRDFDSNRLNDGKTIWPSAKACALCQRFWEISLRACRDDCPLSLAGEYCFSDYSIYRKALDNCILWQNNTIKREAFTKSCKEMIELLESLL